MVVDGPLRQPFSDYMMDTEELGGVGGGEDSSSCRLLLLVRFNAFNAC